MANVKGKIHGLNKFAVCSIGLLALVGCENGIKKNHDSSSQITEERYLSQRCATPTAFNLDKVLAERNKNLDSRDSHILTYVEDISNSNPSIRPDYKSANDLPSEEQLDYFNKVIADGMFTSVSPSELLQVKKAEIVKQNGDPSQIQMNPGVDIRLDKIDCANLTSNYQGPGAVEGMKVKVKKISTGTASFINLEEIPATKDAIVKRKVEIKVESPSKYEDNQKRIQLMGERANGIHELTITVVYDVQRPGQPKETQTVVVKQLATRLSKDTISVKPSVVATINMNKDARMRLLELSPMSLAGNNPQFLATKPNWSNLLKSIPADLSDMEKESAQSPASKGKITGTVSQWRSIVEKLNGEEKQKGDIELKENIIFLVPQGKPTSVVNPEPPSSVEVEEEVSDEPTAQPEGQVAQIDGSLTEPVAPGPEEVDLNSVQVGSDSDDKSSDNSDHEMKKLIRQQRTSSQSASSTQVGSQAKINSETKSAAKFDSEAFLNQNFTQEERLAFEDKNKITSADPNFKEKVEKLRRVREAQKSLESRGDVYIPPAKN